LGDDIVISDPRVAEVYKGLLVRLGVDYSPAKTIDSDVLVEFAKRLFYKGTEITPFPVSSIRECSKSYYVLVNLLIDLSKRGWEARVSVPSAVSAFYSVCRKMPSRFVKGILDKAEYSERVMLITRGAIPAGQALTDPARKDGHTFVLNDEVGVNILRNIAVELFTESNPENSSMFRKKPNSVGLGPFAISLVELLSGY
jgi:hypothetical protein